MQTHHIIASLKRQLKCGRCTKTGHIKACTLNYETVKDAESPAFRDCFK